MPVQILNLSTTPRKKMMWDRGLIELSRRDRELLCSLVASRKNETSFTLPYLRVIKEIIENYEIDAVFMEDEMHRPGVIDMITLDISKPVILMSEKERSVLRFDSQLSCTLTA